jgi:hypothetical protein
LKGKTGERKNPHPAFGLVCVEHGGRSAEGSSNFPEQTAIPGLELM